MADASATSFFQPTGESVTSRRGQDFQSSGPRTVLYFSYTATLLSCVAILVSALNMLILAIFRPGGWCFANHIGLSSQLPRSTCSGHKWKSFGGNPLEIAQKQSSESRSKAILWELPKRNPLEVARKQSAGSHPKSNPLEITRKQSAGSRPEAILWKSLGCNPLEVTQKQASGSRSKAIRWKSPRRTLLSNGVLFTINYFLYHLLYQHFM